MRFPSALAAAVLLASTLAAQNPPKAVGSYKLVLTVQETDAGKRVDSKSYTLMLEEGDFGRVNIGNRVPIETGSGQVQYYDIGMNLRYRVQEREGQLTVTGTAEMSSASAEPPGRAAQPVIRQIRTENSAAVAAGKPATIAALDDPSSRKHYDLEVTVTKLR